MTKTKIIKDQTFQAVIGVPKGVAVHEDKKTHARSVAFPFGFPDGSNGVLIITRVKDKEWDPSKSIKSILIDFNVN